MRIKTNVLRIAKLTLNVTKHALLEHATKHKVDVEKVFVSCLSIFIKSLKLK